MTNPARVMQVSNLFDPRSKVEIDPWSANPLATMMLALTAGQMAVRYEPPPRMFINGTSDLPLFTASGIDPNLLMSAPFGQRHGLAAEPDLVAVHGLFEEYSQMPEFFIDHQGFNEAKQRMQVWARTAGHAEQEAARRAADAAARESAAQNASDRQAQAHAQSLASEIAALGIGEAQLLQMLNRSAGPSAVGPVDSPRRPQ